MAKSFVKLVKDGEVKEVELRSFAYFNLLSRGYEFYFEPKQEENTAENEEKAENSEEKKVKKSKKSKKSDDND